MPERPLLILPAPGAPAARRKKGGGGGSVRRPDRDRQAERLGPRFTRLQEALNARRAGLRMDPHGLVPEEVIVLEVVGTVEGFIRAVQQVEGMEWLAEVAVEDIPPDDDFFALNRHEEPRPEKALKGRLFMVFANHQALEQMLSLWRMWQNQEKLPHGLGRWRYVFERLRDVRPWSVRDRLIETGVLQDWQERADHGQEVVPCEIELWCRETGDQRAAASGRVTALVEGLGGNVVSEGTLPDIRYHGLLAHMPVEAIDPLLEEPDQDMELVQCEQIQFFRATGQMSISLPDDEFGEDPEDVRAELPEGNPVVALFDGLPLQAHRRLDGRLVVDDPDGWEDGYAAAGRRHGTAMASLIIHGDLNSGRAPVARPLYVRPILRQDERAWVDGESVPEDTLVIDLLHRAVRRLFEGDGEDPAAAPEVVLINLSIGIRDRPFDGGLSPLARLLDWLAWRYKVLFLVSAGNHQRGIELSLEEGNFEGLSPDDLQRLVIAAVAADTRHRRLLSPAEAMNALTVASLHEDASNGSIPPGWRDPCVDGGLPSPINAHGMGYRRAIKPELLVPGGRVPLQRSIKPGAGLRLEPYGGTLPPGQSVANPGRTPGVLSAVVHTRGTSNATALLSRAGAEIYEVLDELQDETGGDLIDTIPRSVWLKALLAHGAEWREAATVLESILRNPENSNQFREYVTRLLGYGSVDIDMVRECTAQRVTALSGGTLREDESHIHRFPLPASLSGRRGLRRLVLTLAWLTPVNPRHQSWRRADLWFAPPPDPLRVERQEADGRAVQRGTLQHEVLEGEQASAFVEGSQLEIQVSCRADAGALEEDVPYALVTTLQVADEVGIEIYEEIRTAVVRAWVQVAP